MSGSCVAQGLVAPRHVGSSQTRDQTRVCYTGRQILIHCTTRKVPGIIFYVMRLDEIREGGKPDRAEVWGSSCGLYQCLEFWDLRKNQQKKLRNQLRRQEESPKRVTWRTRERIDCGIYQSEGHSGPCHAPLSDVNSGNKTLLEEDPSTVRGHKFEAGQYIQLFQWFFCCCCKREQENEAVDRGQDLCLGSSLVA